VFCPLVLFILDIYVHHNIRARHSKRCEIFYHMPLATDWVYLAIYVTIDTGGLLHHRFTLYYTNVVVFSLLHLPSDYSGHPLGGVLSHV